MDPAPGVAVAALDCGTNSTRLLIVGPGGTEVRLMRITRLGQGVDATKKLDPEAIARTLAVLDEYREVMDRHRVTRARLVATSAVRDATNGDEFLRAASSASGVPAEMLEGDAEGTLAFAGATASLDLPAAEVVVIDIGGGSTELVTGTGEVRAISLDLGCVRLTERFLHHDPPRPDELDAAVRFVRRASSTARPRPSSRWPSPDTPWSGWPGPCPRWPPSRKGLAHYDRDRIHHFVLDAATVVEWCRPPGRRDGGRRGRRPGMAPGREDVIVGGVVVLREAMGRFGFDRCVVSEADILDGIVASLLAP